jgi:hypothetical protein
VSWAAWCASSVVALCCWDVSVRWDSICYAVFFGRKALVTADVLLVFWCSLGVVYMGFSGVRLVYACSMLHVYSGITVRLQLLGGVI